MATRLAKFEFQQGFHRETTPYAEGQRWFDGNYVRFRAGRQRTCVAMRQELLVKPLMVLLEI